ncbi:MAG: 16S rRNA (cytidine(1402)-2'-O)-methyltransferase, partial [Myxococcales bacterium]|nr:16S rRNA (cytidine(1402)-2'-O)-methyltransferase [Myxococcales bacterium]
PTPLGNLADLAPRSRELLGSLPVLLCEDTRTTSKLLAKLEIPAPSLLPVHDHNERQQVGLALAKLEQGDVGLVSEAGTPLVSDPGFVIVRAVVEAGHEVVSVPGPNAVTAALAGSGLPVDRFVFVGFPPRSTGKRRAWLEPLAHRTETVVLYEAPRRVVDLLEDLAATFGPQRPAALAVNLSKLGERFVRGTVASVRAELAAEDEVRGEMTLVVGGSPGDDAAALWERADRAIATLAGADAPAGAIRDAVCALVDLPRREVYQRVLEALEDR